VQSHGFIPSFGLAHGLGSNELIPASWVEWIANQSRGLASFELWFTIPASTISMK
jgi:hypothetical protein